MLDLGERGFYNAAVACSFRETEHNEGCEAPEPRLGVVNIRHGKADAFKCGVPAPKARIKPDDLLLESVEAALEAQASGEDGKGNGFGDEGDALTRSSQNAQDGQGARGLQGSPKATA